MILARVRIKGFRNFKDAVIHFSDKSLIIGANDVGKTNLICALRFLLDKSFSPFDIEPKDSDFYAYEETNEFSIALSFIDVTEDCVVSKLKDKISDDGKLIILYKASRDKVTLAKKYSILIGPTNRNLEEIEDRYYLKVLNLKYISSRRDFYKYINREKSNLLQLSKKDRDEVTVAKDDKLYAEIAGNLKKVDEKLPLLSYIASATDSINNELEKLSIHHKRQKVVFDASSSNIENFIENVAIAAKNNDKSLLIGGDGRLNQIYLSLWAARNAITEGSLMEVSIICIEEPEAHLHPHQQRKLAEYLSASINAQVVITTHSPQIASEYSPNSVIRLFEKGEGTIAANNGCSEIIKEAFEDFGYRMSIIPAEAFFADVVLLVEGPSEELFYKTLAKQLNIDLDRLNISILMVDGVGFETFVDVLQSLEIAWIVRTDNDIQKIPKKEAYRFAGVQRIVKMYKQKGLSNPAIDEILEENRLLLFGFKDIIPAKENRVAAAKIRKVLLSYGLYLSTKDLEHDLFNGPLKSDLESYFQDFQEGEIVAQMQKRKATFMYDFLKSKKGCLKKLADDGIAVPLIRCKEIVEAYQA